MKEYLRLIDTNTSGQRCDVTPLFADAAAFAQLVEDLSLPFKTVPIDYVAGIDALGFILGSAMAVHLKKGFIPIRKGGKLPVKSLKKEFIDYTGNRKSLELRSGVLLQSARVLLVDEWIETGAQMQAAAALIEQEGGIIAGIATINIDDNPVPRFLQQKYHCHALLFDMQDTAGS